MARASAINQAFDVAGGSHRPFEFSAFASAYLNVMRAIQERAGLILLIGAPGSGKTTLLRTIQDALPRKRGRVIFRSRPGDRQDELLRSILADLRVTAISPGRDDRLEALAASIERRSAPTVLLVDDAHQVPNRTMTALAAIAMHRHGEAASLQIVLSGDPQLDEQLQQPALAWIADHITSRVQLDRLGDDEIGQYIVHRLANAPRAFPWAKGAANPFAPEAVNQVLRYSHGVPATVNRLCQSALSGGLPRVDAAQIHRAAVKCGLSVVSASEEPEPVKAAADTPPPPPEGPDDNVVVAEAPVPQTRPAPPRAGYGIVLASVAAGLAAALVYQATSIRDLISRPRPAVSSPVETTGKAPVTWVQIAPLDSETSSATSEARIPVAPAEEPNQTVHESPLIEVAEPVVEAAPAVISDMTAVSMAPEPQVLPAPPMATHDEPPASPIGRSEPAVSTAPDAPPAEEAPPVVGAIAADEPPTPAEKRVDSITAIDVPTAETRAPVTSPDLQVAEAPPPDRRPEPRWARGFARAPLREETLPLLEAQALPHAWPGPARVEEAVASATPAAPLPKPSTNPVQSTALAAPGLPESAPPPPDPPRLSPPPTLPAVPSRRAELSGAPSRSDTPTVTGVHAPVTPVTPTSVGAIAAPAAPERVPPRTEERVAARPVEPSNATAQPAVQSPTPVQRVAPAAVAMPAPAPPAIEMLLARGRALLESGDPASARLFFERAAAQGHAGALAAVAQTFDPVELQRYGLIGPKGDAQRALDLYRRAAAAGDIQSQERIGRLEQWVASHPPPR
jgi:type II secretory pathway predicted ATPase ExeA